MKEDVIYYPLQPFIDLLAKETDRVPDVKETINIGKTGNHCVNLNKKIYDEYMKSPRTMLHKRIAITKLRIADNDTKMLSLLDTIYQGNKTMKENNKTKEYLEEELTKLLETKYGQPTSSNK